jgi:outer membrane protein OmpA-like peptidoglycan-associated protein
MRDSGDRQTLRPFLRRTVARLGPIGFGGALMLGLAHAPAAAQQYISADRNVIVDYGALDQLGPGPATAPALGTVQGYPYGYLPSPAYGYQPSVPPSSAPQSMLFVPKPFVPGPIAPIKPSGTQAKPATSVASAPTPPPAPSPSPQPVPPLVPSTASAAPAAPEAPAETAAMPAPPPAPPAPPPAPPEAPSETAETMTPSPPAAEVTSNVETPPPPEAPAAEAPTEPAETESAEIMPEASEAETPSAPETPSEAEAPAASESTAATGEAESATGAEASTEAAPAEGEASQTAALPPAPPGDSVQIVFAGESAELPPDILPQLDALADKLLQDENLRLQLMAYASGTEDTASKARRISLSRALAVRAYLIGKGIRSTRMDVRALGNKVEGEPADRVDIVTQTP